MQVNFELHPGPVQLLLGPNGAGKSTVRHVLAALRRLVVVGQLVTEAFPVRSMTRWEQRNLQTFELAVRGNGGRYDYRLEVEHNRDRKLGRVGRESLEFDGKPLFSMDDDLVQLYRDDHSTGPWYPTSRGRSGICNVPPGRDNTRLTWFKDWMAGLCCVRIDPMGVRSDSVREDAHPDEDLSNFASWYRHLAQEKPAAVHELFESLAGGVIEGFRSLNLARMSEDARTLKVDVEGPGGGPILRFDLDELSDGQRSLILLYALLHGAMQPGTTLLIDDPVAHVALGEIQAWLSALIDRADDIGAQVLVISHHPEIVNHLAGSSGLVVRRDRNGPTRVQPFDDPSGAGLPPAEMIARGWAGE